MLVVFREWFYPYQQWKYKAIEVDEWKDAIEQTLDTIYERLIIRVHHILKEQSESKEILFVPSQSLALLPLHAASWKDANRVKRYLFEEYTISYAPSISVFKRCVENEKQRSNKTLFVTNPTGDLYFSEQEVSYIERLQQPSRNYSGKDATKRAVIEALREAYGFTHFSCHGFYRSENPFESGLVMFDGEVIKLGEIINCNLKSNWLTTLSACETGMVDFQSPTDEHFGLPLGFIFAGSPSVWASLWSVSDLATSDLMQEAYENLGKEEYKSNKPEALRQAQLSMLRGEFPFNWAGFQHFGV
jgi:CHAT domain-containing protein